MGRFLISSERTTRTSLVALISISGLSAVTVTSSPAIASGDILTV